LLVKDQSAAMAQIDPEKMGALMERAKAMTSAPGLQGMMERLREQIGNGLMKLPDPTPQQEPTLDSERFVEIYCSDNDLKEFEPTLNEWTKKEAVTINIS
jgi:hypothetical protein